MYHSNFSMYTLPKWALYRDSKTALKRHLKALASSFYDALHIHSDNPGWHGQMLRPSGENESRCSPQQEQHYFCVCLCTGVCKTLFEKVSVDRKRNLKTTNLSKHSSDVTFTFPLTGHPTYALSPEAVHNFGHLLTIRFQLMRNKLLSPTPSIRWSRLLLRIMQSKSNHPSLWKLFRFKIDISLFYIFSFPYHLRHSPFNIL